MAVVWCDDYGCYVGYDYGCHVGVCLWLSCIEMSMAVT